MSSRKNVRNTRNNRRNRNKRIVKRTVISRHNPSYPPQNKAKPECTRVLRYYATTAVSSIDITGRCLLNLIIATSTATTTAINVYEAMRITRVSMYFVPSSTGGFGNQADELVLNWRGERSPDVRMSDRGTLSHPACVKSVPPPESLAAFWVTNQGNIDSVLFNISCPAATIIDVGLAMTIGDGNTRSVTLAAVGTTTGIEYLHLDNATSAGTVGGRVLAPDSLTTQNVTTP